MNTGMPWRGAGFALALLLIGCSQSQPSASVQQPSLPLSEHRTKLPKLRPSPRMYAKGLTLQQGRPAEKIGPAVAVFEAQVVGNVDPLWDYAYLLDDSRVAKALNRDLYSDSSSESELIGLGGTQALVLLHRLRGLSASISAVSRAGIPLAPLSLPTDAHDLCDQIALKEMSVGAVLEATPGFSRDYVAWVSEIEQIANKI